MSARRRIRVGNSNVTIGGSVATPEADVDWRPGYSIGPNDEQFSVGASNDGIDLIEVETTHGVGSALAMDLVEVETNHGVGAATFIDHLDVDINQGVGVSLADPEFDIADIPTSQDTWVGVAIGCPDNTNHDGEALNVEGSVATEVSRALLEWDLSGFTGNTTVLEASIEVTVDAIPTTNQTVSLLHIAEVDEGWDETTVTCSTRPGNGATASASSYTVTGTLGGGSPGDRYTFPIDTAAGLQYLSDRMGVGGCSFYIRGNAVAGLLMAFESSETATAGNEPVLNLRFEVAT